MRSYGAHDVVPQDLVLDARVRAGDVGDRHLLVKSDDYDMITT